MSGFGDLIARLFSGAGRAAEEAAPAFTARAYRGSPIGETWAPEGSLPNRTFWASDSRRVADFCASDRGVGPNVVPADITFRNPLIVDAGGNEWASIPWGSGTTGTDELAELARERGHDGLIVRNVRDMIDGGPAATTFAAVRPNTVRSALTRQRIYSGAAAAGAGAGTAAITQPTDAKADTMEPEGFGDQVVRRMLNQQPAASGPLPSQPQQGDDFWDRLEKFKQLVAQTHPAPQQQTGLETDPTWQQHMENIRQFWQRNPDAIPQPPQPELRGRGPGESRDPYAVMDESVEGQLAPYAPVIIPGEGMVLNALSGVGRTLANPRLAAPMAAGIGMLAGMPDASTAGDSPVKQLEDQRALLAQQQQAAYQRREAERAGGIGPKFKAADAEYQALSTKLDSIDHQLDAERNSPAAQQELANRAADLAAEQKNKLARTPFRERNPELAQELPLIGWATSVGLPFMARGQNRLGSFLPGSYAGRVRSAISGFDAAEEGSRAEAIRRAELQNLIDAEPGPLKRTWEGAAAATGARVLGQEAGVVPDLFDAYGSMPEGPEKDAAKRRLADYQVHTVRIGFGTLAGLGGYEAGGRFPERTPDLTGARARVNPLNRLAGEGAVAPELEWGPNHPNWRQRGEGGRFTTKP